MKKILTTITFIAISINCFAQEMKYENGELSIKFINSKKVSNKFNMNSTSKIKSKDLNKVLIKCKLKIIKDKVIDLNKFSLVDHENKLRYRPTDISTQTVGQINISKLLKTDVKLGGMYKLQAGLYYRPEVKDSFTDYNIEGYTNFEIFYSFGKGKKMKKASLYFQPVKFNFKAHFFFAILKKSNNSNLELYYGNKKITDIAF